MERRNELPSTFVLTEHLKQQQTSSSVLPENTAYDLSFTANGELISRSFPSDSCCQAAFGSIVVHEGI
jgi:hypothetical protein